MEKRLEGLIRRRRRRRRREEEIIILGLGASSEYYAGENVTSFNLCQV
jgi:hypothetical protein